MIEREASVRIYSEILANTLGAKVAKGRLVRVAPDAQTFYRLRAKLLRGEALIELGHAENGLSLMEQANAGFLEKGQMVELLDGLAPQAEALEHSGDPVGALAATRRLQALRDTLFRSEHARAIVVEPRPTDRMPHTLI